MRATPRPQYEYSYDGLRISETTGSDTKEYLFDRRNPTGHAQVLEEYVNDVLSKTFVLGHDVIAQHDDTNGLLTLLYDGHGSTRALVDTLGRSCRRSPTTPTATTSQVRA